MANVIVVPKEVRLIEEEVAPEKIRVELSLQEAKHLRDLLGECVCGPATLTEGLWGKGGLWQSLADVFNKRHDDTLTRLSCRGTPTYLVEM